MAGRPYTPLGLICLAEYVAIHQASHRPGTLILTLARLALGTNRYHGDLRCGRDAVPPAKTPAQRHCRPHHVEYYPPAEAMANAKR